VGCRQVDIDNILTIGGFVFSALGFLISLQSLRHGKRFIAVTAIVLLVAVTTGISFYRLYKHEALVKQVGKEIVETLAGNSLTFDELHERLLFRPFPVVTESLFLLIEGGAIRHRLVRIQTEGKLTSVRVYYQPNSAASAGSALESGPDEKPK
jgi:hypothetical protein